MRLLIGLAASNRVQKQVRSGKKVLKGHYGELNAYYQPACA